MEIVSSIDFVYSIDFPHGQGLIECDTHVKHTLHTSNLRKVPRMQWLVKRCTKSEHILHLENLGSVPCIQGLIER